MDIRERRRTETREQIVQAVHDLLAEEHPATISMPQVAARAGTSLRTLYRYFPTKEALIDAASEAFRVSADVVGGTVGLDNFEEWLRHSWAGFTAAGGAIRAQHLTPAGRTMRELRTPRNQGRVRDALRADGVDLPDDDLDRLVDLVVALMSSSMYLELVDRLGQ